MNSDLDAWRWVDDDRYPGFCFTFTRDKSPEQVLTDYGVEIRDARPLAMDTAGAYFPASEGKSLLRAGHSGQWSFCYEELEPVGFHAPILSRLSAGSEAICVFHGADGMTVVEGWRDEERIEVFEPGVTQSLRGSGPFDLFPRVQAALETAYPGTSRRTTVLMAIGEHTGVVLDRHALERPLLTATLDSASLQRNTASGPPPSTADRSALGPALPFNLDL